MARRTIKASRGISPCYRHCYPLIWVRSVAPFFSGCFGSFGFHFCEAMVGGVIEGGFVALQFLPSVIAVAIDSDPLAVEIWVSTALSRSRRHGLEAMRTTIRSSEAFVEIGDQGRCTRRPCWFAPSGVIFCSRLKFQFELGGARRTGTGSGEVVDKLG
jgi:hypothetical protein